MAVKINDSGKVIIKKDLKEIFPKEFVNRELIGKFFDYIMNNFFQKSYERYVNGYIGKKTVALEENDYYIREPSADRQMNQLTPMMTTYKNDEKYIVDYNNFINKLKIQGCNINNQNRLLSSNYWSWCPPINVDMFLNYNFYYWIEEGVEPIELTTSTNMVLNVIGKKEYTYSYNDEDGNKIEIPFTSGLRIKVLNDANTEYNNKIFIVEGVGKSIELIDDTEILYKRDNKPDYYVMERGCIDGNDWSLRNRWFHRSAIKSFKSKIIYQVQNLDDGIVYYTNIAKPDVKYDTMLYKNISLTEKYKTYGEITGNYLRNVITTTINQAKKPILCFNKDIQLYNYGDNNLGYIDLYVEMDKKQLQGTQTKVIQGVELKDGMKIILHIGDKSADDDKIFEISGISTIGTIVLQPSKIDIKKGDGIRIRNNGSFYAGIYFYYNGEEWIEGQQKTHINQSPLFNLYDVNKINLGNTLEYNHSSFKGSKIFDYKTTDDENALIDEDLNKRILADSYGNYIFDNILITQKFTYINYDKEVKNIDGYKFYKINGQDIYLNNWYYSNDMLSQYIITEINVNDINKKIESYTDETGLEINYTVFELMLIPDVVQNKKSNFVYINGELKEEGRDYIFDGYNLKFLSHIKFKNDDNIYIRLIKKDVVKLPEGYYYDLPLSLTSNPKNEDITELKYNECLDQMKSIIENQSNFSGEALAYNNYNDTLKDLSLGTEIIQHSTPILKTMLLNSLEYTDIRTVLSYINGEYSKFKNKFKNVIKTMSDNNEYIDVSDDISIDNEKYILETVHKALEKINIGKEGLEPFYNNGVAECDVEYGKSGEFISFRDCYIPATPAYLGLDNCYEPKIIVLEDNPMKPSVILCHDGSYMKMFEDYRDNALLTMEKIIYQSINDKFKENNLSYNKYKFIPGKFRHTEYTLDEYNEFLTPFLEKWALDNNIKYTINDTYDRDNPFTWNWSSCDDIFGEQLNGSYKAIYLYYFDTERPHTHPWEMLGFSNKPSWWEEKYGKAPYTNANIPMWKDLEEGYIADGELKGYYEEFKRPGLVKHFIPVDEFGNLLNPYQCGITYNEPLRYNAKESWKVGDLGRYEYAWKFTSEYRYALQTVLYLMKPVEWVESNWNTSNNSIIFNNTNYLQSFDNILNRKLTPKDIIVHNELLDDIYIRNIGIQQWISDFLCNENINITNYCGNLIRNMDVQLGYRCAGYYKLDNLKFISDNYGVIPETDYSLNLYKSLTDKNYNYSAMIIQKTSEGYMIDGYDIEKSYFNVLEPEYNGKKSPVEINNKNFIYYNVWTDKVKKIKYKTVYKSLQDIYTIICGYGKYLEDKEGWEFTVLDNYGEIIDFRNKGRDFLLWASLNPENDTIIMLNPGCYDLTINHNHFIDTVGQYVNGFWTIFDSSRNPIYNDMINVYRHTNKTVITPVENIITAVKLNEVEYEHLILFNNITTFGDTLFNPLLCVKTQRLKLIGICVEGWDGTPFAPGYLIDNNGVVSNYDKLADDFRYIYDTDDVRSFSNFGDEAKKTIGFKELPYMSKLFLDDRNIFDFYKGMIKEKGTRSTFNKLNRSSYIMNNVDSSIDLYENWAFKYGNFGYTYNDSSIELNIKSEKITHNPQIINFSISDDKLKNNEIISINWNDAEWIKKKEEKNSNSFDLNESNKLLPTAGYARPDDVDYIFADYNELMDKEDELNVNSKIWIVKKDGRDWDIVKRKENSYISLRCKNKDELLSYDTNKLNYGDLIYVDKIVLNNNLKIIQDYQRLMNNPETIIDKYSWAVFKYIDKDIETITSLPNGYDIIGFNEISFNDGMVINFANGLDEYDNKLYVKKVFNKISLSVQPDIKYIAIDENGNIYQINNIYKGDEFITNATNNDVFYNTEEHLSYMFNNGSWNVKKIAILAEVYAERDESNNVKLISYNINLPYVLERVETKTPNIKHIKSCYMVNNDNDDTLVKVQMYDPLQGILPNDVLKEISYITEFDPVNYNDGNNWDELKEGLLWWDLSKVRYINYYQGDDVYKRNNWGKQLPGSEIAIMEWTKSTIKPEEGINYIEKQIYNESTLLYDTYYFYWVKNPVNIPSKDFRSKSAFVISNIINSPQDLGIIWFAPISVDYLRMLSSSFILGNFDKVALSNDFVVQINFRINEEIDEHYEWELVKENTDDDIPEFLWDKMKASLIGYDELGQEVPAKNLNDNEKLGIELRPRQTMFKNLSLARHNFVDIVNNVFLSRDITTFIDTDSNNWKNIFVNDIDEPSIEPALILDRHNELYDIKDEDLIGKYVLVNHDELYDDIWTLWLVESLTSYKLVEYQQYDISKYWKYVDIYKDEETKLSIPKFVLDNEYEISGILSELSNGDIIKTYTIDGKWILKQYNDGAFYTIGLEDGMIQLTDNLFEFMDDKELKNNDTIFIDNMTKYDYLMKEVSIVINKILSYFEIDD